jgi:hypothetical protein
MSHFISFILLLLIAAGGFLMIYLVIDFFEYLKKYHTGVWEELCFEQPFGIPQKDFFFYPIKPLKFISFLLSTDDPQDSSVFAHKKRITSSFIAFVAVIIVNYIIRSIF